jgi:hypothetical protein
MLAVTLLPRSWGGRFLDSIVPFWMSPPAVLVSGSWMQVTFMVMFLRPHILHPPRLGLSEARFS